MPEERSALNIRNIRTHHQIRAALKIPFPSYTTSPSLFSMPSAETAAAKASSDGNICGNYIPQLQRTPLDKW